MREEHKIGMALTLAPSSHVFDTAPGQFNWDTDENGPFDFFEISITSDVRDVGDSRFKLQIWCDPSGISFFLHGCQCSGRWVESASHPTLILLWSK